MLQKWLKAKMKAMGTPQNDAFVLGKQAPRRAVRTAPEEPHVTRGAPPTVPATLTGCFRVQSSYRVQPRDQMSLETERGAMCGYELSYENLCTVRH